MAPTNLEQLYTHIETTWSPADQENFRYLPVASSFSFSKSGRTSRIRTNPHEYHMLVGDSMVRTGEGFSMHPVYAYVYGWDEHVVGFYMPGVSEVSKVSEMRAIRLKKEIWRLVMNEDHIAPRIDCDTLKDMVLFWFLEKGLLEYEPSKHFDICDGGLIGAAECSAKAAKAAGTKPLRGPLGSSEAAGLNPSGPEAIEATPSIPKRSASPAVFSPSPQNGDTEPEPASPEPVKSAGLKRKSKRKRTKLCGFDYYPLYTEASSAVTSDSEFTPSRASTPTIESEEFRQYQKYVRLVRAGTESKALRTENERLQAERARLEARNAEMETKMAEMQAATSKQKQQLETLKASFAALFPKE